MKVKLIFLFAFVLVFCSGCIYEEQEIEFFGSSTNGVCSVHDDCIVSGCNNEICQSQSEELLSSVCVVPEKLTPLQVGLECRCIDNKCQWN